MRTPLVIALFPLFTQPSASQDLAPRPLGRPVAEFTNEFSQIAGIRELRDGRVVIADEKDRTLQLIDFSAGGATPISRTGAGPNEWQSATRLLAAPGDSTVVVDRMNGRLLMLDPVAKPARTFIPAISLVPTATPQGRLIRSVGGSIVFAVRAIDALGRMYFTGLESSFAPGGMTERDSVPLIRATETRQDTLAWLMVAESSPARPPQTIGGQRIAFGSTTMPFAAGDAWAVFPDGRVVIARARDYRVDMVQPDGRLVTGRKVPYTPIRIGDAERAEWLTTLPSGLTSVSIGRGGDVNAGNSPPANFQRPEPPAWPERKPPFVDGGVLAAPRGETWVLRSRAAKDSLSVYDVFSASGELVRRTSLPAGTRLVGFGAASVYLARTDDVGLEYLQRYAY